MSSMGRLNRHTSGIGGQGPWTLAFAVQQAESEGKTKGSVMTVPPNASHSFRNQLKSQVPNTSLGRWTVGLLGAHLVTMAIWMLVVVVLSTVGDGFESESFFDPPILAVGLIVAGVAALAATVLGLISIFTRRDRSALVIVATVLAAAPTLFFVGEFLSAIGVLPGH